MYIYFGNDGYTIRVTKRLIDIDDALLSEVRAITRASTMKEAVNTAMRELVNIELRRRHLRRLEAGTGIDLADDDTMSGAWR